MTDRDPAIPADLTRPPKFRPQIDLLPGNPSSHAHLESAQRGDCLPMTLTIAPRTSSRVFSTDDLPAGHLRAWLGQITSSSAALTPFAALALPAAQFRNSAEAEAVSRAAGCPDLFIIHAPEQAVRERIIADLAFAKGSERILVLSPDAATADRITERLLKLNVPATRALADDENPARPSPAVARATTSAIAAAGRQRLHSEAATAVSQAIARLNAIDAALSTLAHLDGLRYRCAALDHEVNALTVQREQLEHTVQREAAGTETTAFTSLINQRKSEHQAAIDGIQQKKLTTQALHQQKEALVADLRKQTSELLAVSSKKSGFLTRLLSRSKQNSHSSDLDRQLHDAEAELNEAAAGIAALQRDLEIAAEKIEEDRKQLIAAEIAVRQGELEARLAHLTSELTHLGAEIEASTRALGPLDLPACELDEARQAAEHEVAAARQRVADRASSDVFKEMLAELRVVVGTPGSLQSDPIYERDPRYPADPPFGLLVLDRAEELTEHDFLRLAKLATCWVLAGDVAVSEEHRSHLRGVSNRQSSGHGRNGRALDIPFASRLAHFLDREKWTQEGERLVCRLELVSAEQRRHMTREPLLDRPEIELRLSTNADEEPVLVEVAFPLTMGIAGAKAFLYHQLGEILLRPCGEAAWSANTEKITAIWASADRVSSTGETWIDLEAGIREKITGTGLSAFTAAIEFDPAAGWDLDKARGWLDGHIAGKSLSRFAAIPRR